MKTIQHEVYGPIPASTVALIRKYKVSSSDWDDILYSLGYEWGVPIDNHLAAVVNATIEAGSESGYYQHQVPW